MTGEFTWRLGAFLVVLIAIAIWEAVEPMRERVVPRRIRWPRNLGIIILDNVMMRVLVPITAAGLAIWAQNHDFGIMNWLSLPIGVSLILSVLILDLLIYAQHVLFHWHPWLWRLHMVHHVDQDVDVTTGIRFHPVEILLSTMIKCGAVLILGVPFLGIVAFEIILNASSMFNHGNIKLPKGVDKILRIGIVTPDMHRVHHSVIPKETHSNFGFNLSVWDRVFGTYRAQPKRGHQDMEIGLPDYQDPTKTGIISMLILPFRRRSSRHAKSARDQIND